MTTLAAHPVDDPAQLALVADTWTPLAIEFADAFKAACRAEAQAHDGWIDPSAVRLRLLTHDGYEPRKYAAHWSVACGRDGYLNKTERRVQIHGEGSRGNTNKDVLFRRWRGWDRG